MLGAGALAGGLPLGQAALAQDASAQWPNVARLISDFVATGWSSNAVVRAWLGTEPAAIHGAGRHHFHQRHPRQCR